LCSAAIFGITNERSILDPQGYLATPANRRLHDAWRRYWFDINILDYSSRILLIDSFRSLHKVPYFQIRNSSLFPGPKVTTSVNRFAHVEAQVQHAEQVKQVQQVKQVHRVQRWCPMHRIHHWFWNSFTFTDADADSIPTILSIMQSAREAHQL
jgi:hypothetical protein